VLEANKPEHFQKGKTAKGKETTGFKREYWLNEKAQLCYRMYLAYDGGELFHHLTGKLDK